MLQMRITFYVFSFILVSSCQENDNLTQPVMDDRLIPFFTSFNKEAALRGKNVPLDDISGRILDIETAGVQGRCEHLNSGAKQLYIDSLFWETSSYSAKEYVIFHELGHCALNRRHLDTKNTDGTCVSIMQSGNGSCKMVYSGQNRTKYLDELFLQ